MSERAEVFSAGLLKSWPLVKRFGAAVTINHIQRYLGEAICFGGINDSGEQCAARALAPPCVVSTQMPTICRVSGGALRSSSVKSGSRHKAPRR